MKNPESGDHGLIRSDFPGGWKGDEINGFTKKGLTTQEKDAQNFMKKLLNWRKKSSAIQTGKLTHFEPKDQVYVYFRYDENEKIMVILNKNTNPYSLQLKRFAEMLDGISNAKDVISGNRFNMDEAIELPEKSALILELK
jgi:glycosidase